MDIIPNVHFPERTLARMYIGPNGHFPEILFPWTYTFQNVHLTEWTFPRKPIFQNGHSSECTLVRMYSWPNGQFPENLFSRIDTWQSVHLMLAIIIQEDEIKLLFSKPGYYMFYIRISSTAAHCTFLRSSSSTPLKKNLSAGLEKLLVFALITITACNAW